MKNAIIFILAVVVGGLGLIFLFSDLSPGETWPLRVAVGSLVFLVGGVAIGLIHPKGWKLSALTAWSGVLMGSLISVNSVSHHRGDIFSASEPPYIAVGLAMAILPLVISLIGGYLGKMARNKYETRT